MKCYIEVTLLPNMEAPLYFLWEKVYPKIHMALVRHQRPDGSVGIGVSFPEYSNRKHQLGSKLRLFAQSRKELKDLGISIWLANLSDYTHVTSIKDVPEKIKGKVIFKRVQPKSNKKRLARRKAKRSGITFEEAMVELSKFEDRRSLLPYVFVKSMSSDKRYRLIIDQVETETEKNSASFSTYGLSSESTVPTF